MNLKVICLLVVFVMLLSLVACKSNAEEADDTSATVAETTTATVAETVPGIIYSGVVIIPEEEDLTASSEKDGSSVESIEEATSAATPPLGEESDETVSVTAPTMENEESGALMTNPTTGTTAYEQYNAMSAEAQEEFVDSFDSLRDFVDWYNAAKAEYEALHPDIEIGDGVIDAGDLVGGNG